MQTRILLLFTLLLPSVHTAAFAESGLKKVFSLEQPESPQRRFTGGRQVAVSKNGRTLIVAFYGSSAQLFDLTTGKAICAPLRTAGDGEVGFVSNDIAYTADWEWLRLWDAHTGQAIGEPIAHELREDTIISPAVSPDGTYIATRNTMNSYQIREVASGKVTGESDAGDSPVHRLQFTADGRALLARRGRSLDIINPQDGSALIPSVAFVSTFYTLSDGQLLTVERRGEDRQSLTARSKTGQLIGRTILPGKLKRVRELADGRLLIQTTNSDYSPDLFVTSLTDLAQREQLQPEVDRAFALLLPDGGESWICSNIHDVSCLKFGQQQPVWKLKYPRNGYDQKLSLLGADHLVIHERWGQPGNITTCHKISDGTKLWEQADVIRTFVHKDLLFVCNRAGVDVWTTQ